MRIFALSVTGVLAIAGAVSAQTPAPQNPPTPQIRVTGPPTTPAPLGPRTVSPAIVACTDMPTTVVPENPLRVVASHSGTMHTIYKPGDIVVINGGTPQGVTPGQRYYTRRLQLGFDAQLPSPAAPGAIRTTGWLTIVSADDRFALARIDNGCDDVGPDDYLEPFAEPVLPRAIAIAGPPNFSDMGRVMFGVDRRQTFGSGDLANIDRGKSHGIGTGTRVAFYRDRMNDTPLVAMGEGIVVEVFENTSKVVLTRTNEAVWRGDYVVILGTPVPPQ
jgi:hypothetical protein